jgi:hypothetical protein
MQVCGKAKIKIGLYTGGELDLSTASGGSYGFMETGRSWYELAIKSQRVKDAVERNVRAGSELVAGRGRSVIRSSAMIWARVGDGGIGSSATAIPEARTRLRLPQG